MTKYWAIMLFLACLAAGLLGYAITTPKTLNDSLEGLRTPEMATNAHIVDEYGIEAQDSYLDYNDYESHVAEIINDRSRP